MNKKVIVAFGLFITVLLLTYIIGGFYCGHKTVYRDHNLMVAKNQLENINWKNYCELREKDIKGITSYSFDCGGKFDVESEKFKTAVEDFAARTHGIVILKLYTRLSNQVWNEARMEPISIWAFDALWLFQ
ncbi:MAG TPA: hypothetical protein P5230_03330 [Candidatus Magasanikbacteria bacterium]|nr:hypothetical protein [Candidatus Magasanikbacteria bacterium]